MNILGLAISDWFLLFLLGLAALYLYGTWYFKYFESQGLKNDPPLPFLGNMLKYRKKYLHLEDQRMYQAMGRIYGMYEGRNPVLMVGDPDMIKQIFVKNFTNFPNRRTVKFNSKNKIVEKFLNLMEGDEWRRTRHLLTPTFTSGKLKQMSHLMEECALEGIQNTLETLGKSNTKSINVKEQFSLYTMNVISSCAFGLKANCKSLDDPIYVHSKTLFAFDTSWKLVLLLLAPSLSKALDIEFFPTASLLYLKGIAKDVMERRKREGIRRPDFLQLLLDAQQDEEKENAMNENASKIGNKIVLDETCLIAQAMLFLLAGFESVASTASFAVYLLSQNPDCYQKLMDEIAETKEQNNGNLSTESIMKMPYIDMVISETLRIYPSATRLERVCNTDLIINNIHIKKGMMAAVPVYAVQHDETFFPDPEKFDPERFSPERKDSINPYTYLPFGSGPRNCIGMRFAQMQLKIGLVHYLEKFKFSIAPETEQPLQLKIGIPQIILKHGLTLNMEEIN